MADELLTELTNMSDFPSFHSGDMRPPKASMTADRALASMLETTEFRPGAKLPTERALAEQLSIPRSAVRAALARLEAHGKVVRIIGSGTYVAEPSVANEPPPADYGIGDASPQEIMEVRRLIEPLLAGLVVANANGADIESIREASRQAEAAQSFEAFELWDGHFHQALAQATHNRLMIEIYLTVTRARDQAEWGELKRRSITPERRKIYEDEHREILRSLQARDADAATRAIAGHIATVHRNLLGDPMGRSSRA